MERARPYSVVPIHHYNRASVLGDSGRQRSRAGQSSSECRTGEIFVSPRHAFSNFEFLFRALKEADLILLVGARLNWILHFGLQPRFRAGVKILQIDLAPEEFHQNVPTTVPLLGDIGETVEAVRIL